MPELPDVESFRALAQRHFSDAEVSHVTVSDPGSLEGITAAALRRRLNGRALRATARHGKYLFLDFGEQTVLVLHFGPAGLLRRFAAGEPPPAYVRVQLDFTNGESLAYVNRRRIGRVGLVSGITPFVEQAKLGPDALDPALDFAGFAARVAGRKPPVKVVLTDQARISGIGNTWSDEILFQARIHPAVSTVTLTTGENRTLFGAMRRVLKTAVELDPAAADFLTRLPADFMLPERHPGGHCPRCGTELNRAAISGHTATFCPRCQRSK